MTTLKCQHKRVLCTFGASATNGCSVEADDKAPTINPGPDFIPRKVCCALRVHIAGFCVAKMPGAKTLEVEVKDIYGHISRRRGEKEELSEALR